MSACCSKYPECKCHLTIPSQEPLEFQSGGRDFIKKVYEEHGVDVHVDLHHAEAALRYAIHGNEYKIGVDVGRQKDNSVIYVMGHPSKEVIDMLEKTFRDASLVIIESMEKLAEAFDKSSKQMDISEQIAELSVKLSKELSEPIKKELMAYSPGDKVRARREHQANLQRHHGRK